MIGDSVIIKMAVPDYTKYNVLAFDIYGTLIDWKGSVLRASLPLFKHSNLPIEEIDVVTSFNNHERKIQAEEPTLSFRDVVKLAELRTRAEFLDKSEAVVSELKSGLDIGKWPAFFDSVDALQRLSKYFKIVAYSNVDHKTLSDTLSGPLSGVRFDAKYIAEDIGCYKPDPRFMEYLIRHANEDFGAKRDDILIVAHGLEMNHVPGKEMDMPPGVWIMRGETEIPKEYAGKVDLGARFETLKELADTVEACFEGKGKVESVTPEMSGVEKPHVPDVLQTLEDKGLGGS